jgi:capsular polysaccharide biosynthesis protein
MRSLLTRPAQNGALTLPLPQDDPRLGDYVAMARRQWQVIVALAFVVAALAVVASYALPSPVQARTLVVLESETRPLPGGDDTPPDVSLELAIAQSEEVEDRAEEALGREPVVAIAQVADRPLLTITASGTDEEAAERAANAYAAAFIAVRNDRVATALQVGLESVEARLVTLTSVDASTTAVDPQELTRLRLAAELLGQAATSGDLAAVEAAAEQVRDAAAEPLVTDDALLLVRRTQLQQLTDQLVVAIDTLEAAGPRIAVEAEVVDARGVLSLLPVALVAGALLGVGVGLVRELRDGTVHRAVELPSRTGGAPLVAELTPDGDGAEPLRSAVLLARPRGGIVQIAAVDRLGPEAVVARTLEQALRQAGREVDVVDARPADGGNSAVAASPGERTAPPEVAAAHPGFARCLAERVGEGRLVLVLSPTAVPSGDAALVATAADSSLLVVDLGHDRRTDVQAAAQVLSKARDGLLGTVTVTGSQLAAPAPR